MLDGVEDAIDVGWKVELSIQVSFIKSPNNMK